MARRSLPRKVTYFEPVPPRLARNTIIESTFEVGRRLRCTMRVDCGQRSPRRVLISCHPYVGIDSAPSFAEPSARLSDLFGWLRQQRSMRGT
jgi:hypothetical protein